MLKSEGEQKTELVVAAAMAPDVSDAVIAEVAQTIRDLERAHKVSLVVTVGRLIVERLYGGNAAAVHARGPKASPLSRLAAQEDLPFSLPQLSRAVGIYESVAKLGPVDSWRHLTMTHVRTVLPLPAPERQTLLEKAEAKGWSVKQLEAQAKKTRKDKSTGGGRPPLPAITKSVLAVKRLVDEQERILERDEELTEAQIGALLMTVSALKLQCTAIQERMTAKLRAREG